MTYICDNCGHKTEESADMICLICRGRLLTEQQAKERDEIQEALQQEQAEENPFDNSIINEAEETQVQDMTDEQIANAMKEDIFHFGNDDMWQLIEDIPDFKDRIKYRNIFFKVGGTTPTQEE